MHRELQKVGARIVIRNLVTGTYQSPITNYAPQAWLFGLAVAGMFIGGATNLLTNRPVLAIIQAAVAGPVADLIGVRSWYLIGGAAAVLIGVAAFFIPSVIHIENELQAADLTAAVAGETAAAD